MSEATHEVGILVVTHGSLAAELVAATTTILGGESIPRLRPLSIGWNQPVDEARASLEAAVEECNAGSGVLVLTDMFGGTPSNISLSFLDDHPVEVVTGGNLPMLIKLATGVEPESLEELATFIKDYGRRNISVASQILPGGSE